MESQSHPDPSLDGVIFDLDGTLVDSLKTTFDAFNHGFRLCGIREHTPHEIMAHFGKGEDHIFLAMIPDPARAKAAYEASIEYTRKNSGVMPLHDGVDELLNFLSQKKVPISIVTGRSWNTTEIILKHHGLLDRLVTVIAHDHVSQSKPSPEGIELALKRMKLAPEQAIYIGDTHVDIRAAKRAGTLSMAVTYDTLADRAALQAESPDLWASHAREVIAHLEQRIR
jgi:HAD superfamily hydrolase (TIGR01549 family)